MPIFDRLKHGVDVTKFKAEQLIRINQVESEVNNLRREIANIRMTLAQKAIDLHLSGQLQNPELSDICRLIDNLNRDIRDKEVKIQAIRAEEAPQFSASDASDKPHGTCPNCQAAVPLGSTFCTNCGTQIPASLMPQLCPNCHHTMPVGALFCTECGYRTPQA